MGRFVLLHAVEEARWSKPGYVVREMRVDLDMIGAYEARTEEDLENCKKAWEAGARSIVTYKYRQTYSFYVQETVEQLDALFGYTTPELFAIIGGEPYRGYTGTLTFTRLELVGSTPHHEVMKEAVMQKFDEHAGLMLVLKVWQDADGLHIAEHQE